MLFFNSELIMFANQCSENFVKRPEKCACGSLLFVELHDKTSMFIKKGFTAYNFMWVIFNCFDKVFIRTRTNGYLSKKSTCKELSMDSTSDYWCSEKLMFWNSWKLMKKISLVLSVLQNVRTIRLYWNLNTKVSHFKFPVLPIRAANPKLPVQ